ncbi:hypothetical protein H9638_09640 [Arthrobacter sp. Sa2BUA2]|uniref:Uncharacterized protein n=1 Tax=Arthrobacter pullicola TaxID=2762224 RepID=A0ABR8YIL3_9MICC|nr:hypothetical protein [Arthrobacter pullicola]MBD8044068.1 hypothetical protein [Arthrobacter pullicola]
MNQETNQPTDPAGAAVPADAENTVTAAREGLPVSPAESPVVSGTVPAAGRRRSRRSTAAPATLRRAAELVQSAPSNPRKADTPPAGPDVGSGRSGGRPAAGGDSSGDAAVQAPHRHEAGQRAGSGLPRLAREDDPRAWGDQPDDSADWLREQRPPHWG